MAWKHKLRGVLEDWDGGGIVTSPDIDGLLCAALIAEVYGSRLIGIYTTRHLLLLDNATAADTRSAIWLDHDISQPGVRCIGQHLVLHSSDDELPRRHQISFNPNLFYGQTAEDSFQGRKGRSRDKYPFATIHLLLSALDISLPESGTSTYSLLAHPDGAWATPCDYPVNCGIWNDLMFDDFYLINNLVEGYTRSTSHLAKHKEVLEALVQRGIAARGSSYKKSTGVPDDWLQLEGHQSIRYQSNWNAQDFLAKVLGVLDYIAIETGWVVPTVEKVTGVIEGEVVSRYPNSVPRGAFDHLMVKEGIFSHAITGITQLRYTKDIEV